MVAEQLGDRSGLKADGGGKTTRSALDRSVAAAVGETVLDRAERLWRETVSTAQAASAVAAEELERFGVHTGYVGPRVPSMTEEVYGEGDEVFGAANTVAWREDGEGTLPLPPARQELTEPVLRVARETGRLPDGTLLASSVLTSAAIQHDMSSSLAREMRAEIAMDSTAATNNNTSRSASRVRFQEDDRVSSDGGRTTRRSRSRGRESSSFVPFGSNLLGPDDGGRSSRGSATPASDLRRTKPSLASSSLRLGNSLASSRGLRLAQSQTPDGGPVVVSRAARLEWLEEEEATAVALPSLWGGDNVALLSDPSADAAATGVRQREGGARVLAATLPDPWWAAALSPLWRRTLADRNDALLWDAEAAEDAVLLLAAFVRCATQEGPPDIAAPLLPVCISSVAHLHWAIRKWTLSPAFRGDDAPLSPSVARALLASRTSNVRLLQISHWALAEMLDSQTPAAIDAMPLPPNIRTILHRLFRGGPQNTPLGLVRAIAPLPPQHSGILGKLQIQRSIESCRRQVATRAKTIASSQAATKLRASLSAAVHPQTKRQKRSKTPQKNL